ncbi:MAG: hypothetical protein M0010_18595 [Actinomycetota bacterium]|jgi:hypothetical protein|nr:hypothetical protein [Actinomycetota bacterium]
MSVHGHRDGRAFHALDLENLVGAFGRKRRARAATLEGAVRAAIANYVRVAGLGECDHGVAVGSRRFVRIAAFELPHQIAWRVSAPVPDGADQALLDLCDPGFLAQHYERVVIGSGDHFFAPFAAQLAGLGVAVDVVARHGACSSELRRCVRRVVMLGEAESLVA